MRLEIVIPDNTRPELKAMLTSLTQELSAHPERVESIQLGHDYEDEVMQNLFTSQVLAELDNAASEARAGQSFSSEQVDEHLAKNKAAWLVNHPV